MVLPGVAVAAGFSAIGTIIAAIFGLVGILAKNKLFMVIAILSAMYSFGFFTTSTLPPYVWGLIFIAAIWTIFKD